MKPRNPFRRRRPPTPPHRPDPSTTTRKSGEYELRGHSSIVFHLATVPTADSVLLASADTQGGLMVWDGPTGEHLAGPVISDSVNISGLAAVDLGTDGWALACSGPRGVTLWDPLRVGELGYVPRRVAETGSALAVIPGESPLIVLVDAEAVRVLDVASGETLFSLPQPPHPKGHIGNQVHRVIGVRFDDEMVGFAADRYGTGIELWKQSGNAWRRHDLVLSERGRGVMTAYGTSLAITARRGVEVWDLRSGEHTVRGDLDTAVEHLAPVPLGDRAVLAAAFRQFHESGVQLWDPQEPTALSTVLNHHGPAFGIAGMGSATINAISGFVCPDGKTRVATAANDGCVVISAPLDQEDLVVGQRPGPIPPQTGGGNFAHVRTRDGEIVGLWFASTEHARDRMLVQARLFSDDLLDLLDADFRVVPNKVDGKGGAFVMFNNVHAPGE